MRRSELPTSGQRGRRRHRNGAAHAADTGSVSVEAALALPSLVLVLGMMLWATAAVTGQLRCVDAARVAARAAARGESEAVVAAAAHRLAPDGATVRIAQDGELIRVIVTAEIGASGMVGRLVPHLAVMGDATVAAEPSR